jgi:hypothetical protein
MNDEFTPAPAEPISMDAPISTEGSPTPPEPVSESTSRRDALERALAKVEGDEPAAEGPQRGPDGKFAAKQPTDAPPVELKEPAKPDASPLTEPPARFSPDAKAAWAQAPVPVQAEIKRAITELETGLRQKDEILAPLKPYFDLAQQHNVKVHDALGNYVRMEQILAKDPRAGLTAIAENFGWTLDQLLSFVSDKPAQQQGQPDQRDQTIVALRRELDAIKGQVGTVTQTLEQQRVTEVMKSVESFAAQNPRFAELENDILRLLQTGYADTLEAAYQYAERLNPAPQTAAPAATVPTPQTRPARSVTGAPNAGSTPGSRPPSSNRREALGNALAQVGL